MRLLICLMVLLSYTNASFAKDRSTEEFLSEFHRNPEKMFSKLPPEVKDGEIVDRGFINSEFLDLTLLVEKEKVRAKIRNQSEFFPNPMAAATDGDHVSALVDNGVVLTNIFDLDRRGVVAGKKLTQRYWSDSYWPIAQGLLGNRYAAGGNPRAKTGWATNHSYFLSNPTWATSTDLLSPAEKYDLLLGDSNMTMTNFSWSRGRYYHETHNGYVPSWMGICHGWSAATHMEAKIPYGSIVLRSPNGTPIRFYQSDVKALTSLLWANTTLPTRFVGYRCDAKPPRDGQGRTVDEKCRDNNPGTLFLALTNQLGINNRSIVVDATYDAEVWNFAVISYSSTYFNPQTFQQTNNLRQAIIPLHQFTIDKFRKHRAPGTAYVVGVTLDMTHLNEAAATHGVQVKPRTQTKRYVMDIELDANYNVIGGEWYTRVHPDFLWTYAKGAQALAPGDADIIADDWNVANPVPPGWAEAARKSSKTGMPLYSVIRKIVEAAPNTPPANSTEEFEFPPVSPLVEAPF